MKNQRVEIPAYTDRWMMGDRCGTIVRTYEIDTGKPMLIARVKLDISGKTVSVILDDCRLIDGVAQ